MINFVGEICSCVFILEKNGAILFGLLNILTNVDSCYLKIVVFGEELMIMMNLLTQE